MKKETLLKNSLRVEGTSTLDRQLAISAEGADVTGNSVFQNRLEVKGATTLESGATVNGSALVVNTGHIDTSSTATTMRCGWGRQCDARAKRQLGQHGDSRHRHFEHRTPKNRVEHAQHSSRRRNDVATQAW